MNKLNRRLFIQAALFLGITTIHLTANAQDKKMPTDKELLQKLYQNFYRFKINADISGLNQILANDFTLTHMTGYKQPRQEWLSEVKSGKMRYFKAVEEELIIQHKDNTAMISSKNKVTAQNHGIKGSWNLRLMMNCQKINNRWIISNIVASSY